MSLIREYHSDMGLNELHLMNTELKTEPVFYEKMIANNNIPGLLKYRTDLVEGHKKYVYNADGMKLLSAVLSDKKPNMDMLKTILEGMLQTIEMSREYLLSEQDFVILPDCMFLGSDGKPSLCCLPGYTHGLKEQLTSLFEYLMNYLDYEDKAAVVALYELYRRSREMVFTFEDIRSILERKPEEKTPPVYKQNLSEGTKPDPLPALPPLPVQNASVQKEKETSKPKRSIFGSHKTKEAPKINTEKTTLLYRPAEEADYVMRAEDGKEIIFLNRFPFYIGKGTANINHDLQYPQISRLHAKITMYNQNLYLEDMKSTNGCSVNDQRISSDEPVQIKPGDRIGLANRMYILELRK